MVNLGQLTEVQRQIYVHDYERKRELQKLNKHEAEMLEVKWVEASNIDVLLGNINHKSSRKDGKDKKDSKSKHSDEECEDDDDAEDEGGKNNSPTDKSGKGGKSGKGKDMQLRPFIKRYLSEGLNEFSIFSDFVRKNVPIPCKSFRATSNGIVNPQPNSSSSSVQ
jgi:hypothetical protein